MSYFPDSNDCAFVDDRSSTIAEADGVTVHRRRMLQVSGFLAGALLLRGSARAQSGAHAVADPGSLQWFLEELLPMARELTRTEGADETLYLHRVAGLLTQLRDPAENPRTIMRTFREQNAREGEPFPLAIVQMNMKPGARLGHHDHRDYNGVIVGVSGEVRIRNYDILGEQLPPAGKTFQIRQTEDSLITAGRFSRLERARDNVHELVAGPEGAVVLDVFTFFAKGARSHWMEVEQKPRDAEKRIFDAAWSAK